MTIRVELDRNGKLSAQNPQGEIQRIAPRYPQHVAYSHRTRFKIGATVYAFGKVYAAELHEDNAHRLDVAIWNKGRAIQERHLLDVRQAVKEAYAAAFGLKCVIKLGVGTIYRRSPELVQTGVTL